MDDIRSALRDRRLKVEARVNRATKTLELLKKELLDLEAAERVFARITGDSLPPHAAEIGGSDRDKVMTRLLAADPAGARTPAELHPIYVEESGDEINLDAFRTALWRLQKKIVQGDSKNWAIRSEGGRYWREAAPDDPVTPTGSEEPDETN